VEDTYPVPHCSILVMFSCRRPLSQASSSCLYTTRSSVYVSPTQSCCRQLLQPSVGCVFTLTRPLRPVLRCAKSTGQRQMWWCCCGDSRSSARGRRDKVGGDLKGVVEVDGQCLGIMFLQRLNVWSWREIRPAQSQRGVLSAPHVLILHQETSTFDMHIEILVRFHDTWALYTA
jgi:hypothetical protein